MPSDPGSVCSPLAWARGSPALYLSSEGLQQETTGHKTHRTMAMTASFSTSSPAPLSPPLSLAQALALSLFSISFLLSFFNTQRISSLPRLQVQRNPNAKASFPVVRQPRSYSGSLGNSCTPACLAFLIQTCDIPSHVIGLVGQLGGIVLFSLQQVALAH